MLVHILWINEAAAFVGGCEQYIFNTVQQLKLRGIRSTLLYNPLQVVDPEYIEMFDHAFPALCMEEQLEGINADVIYIHQIWNPKAIEALGRCRQPVVRFYHDHRLFCLRKHKITTVTKKPCYRPVGLHCYPCLGFLERRPSRLGIGVRTLSELRREQERDKRLDAFVVASQYMRGQLLAHDYDECKISIIPLFANESQPPIPRERGENVLLYVGQLLPGKGLSFLLRALAKLEGNFQLVVAGTGRGEEHCKGLAQELGLNSHVTFLGYVDQDRLQSLYQQASCLIMPSQAPETFGMIGVEAMRWGTPTIAVDLGGVDEWLEHGVTGLKVAPSDPKALRSAIQDLLKEPELLEELSQNCRKRYEDRFTPATHIESLLNLFSGLRQERHQDAFSVWGRFTPQGSSSVEKKLQKIVNEVRELVHDHVAQDHIHSLSLIGGYGKGEGGVLNAEGEELPHNNLDFVLVTKKSRDVHSARYSIESQLEALRKKWDLGIDFSFVSHGHLSYGSPMLIWYEMCAGGRKTLLGDNDAMTQLALADVSQVPDWDIMHLMVNRGTLLLINLWIGDTVDNPEQYQKLMIKHIMKAIIGYGDALLYFLGDYHWSYQKKARRLMRRTDVEESFKQLYQEAKNFRLAPNYDAYAGKDLRAWSMELLDLFSEIFLCCERIRLQQSDLEAGEQMEATLRRQVSGHSMSARASLRKAKALLSPPKLSMGQSWLARAGFLTLSGPARLASTFPVVAFSWGSQVEKEQVASYLGAKGTDLRSLREAYLRRWGQDGDSNFQAFLKQNALILEDAS